jgi:hypothetical protein
MVNVAGGPKNSIFSFIFVSLSLSLSLSRTHTSFRYVKHAIRGWHVSQIFIFFNLGYGDTYPQTHMRCNIHIRDMYFDMVPYVVFTLGWLPNPHAGNVGQFFLPLPDTPDVIKLHCFLKNLEEFRV